MSRARKTTLSIVLVAGVVILMLAVIGAIVTPMMVSAYIAPGGGGDGSLGQEVVNLRTETSKTYYLGNNRYALDCYIGAIHYKDDYADSKEQWKDIDLTWEGNRITRAPYELTLEGNKVTVKDKKTGEVSTIELLEIGSIPIPPQAWERSEGLAKAFATDLEIVAGNGSVSFARILKSDKAAVEAKYRVIGNLPLRVRASDTEGELPVEWTIEDGILTETLKPDRPIKYPVRIDPTIEPQVGASADDNMEYEDEGSCGNIIETLLITRSSTYVTSRYWSGFRFVSGEFPAQNTVIDVAYLRVYVPSDAMDDANFNIHFEELAAPAAFTADNFNITGRDRTEASTPWIADGIAAGGAGWYNSPSLCGVGSPIQEVFDAFSPTTMVVITRPNQDVSKIFQVYAWDYNNNTYGAILHLEWGEVANPPTVTTQAATNIEATTATGNGNITAVNNGSCDIRGFVWDLATQGAPGNVTPGASGYANDVAESDGFGTGAFTGSLTGLPTGDTIYARAYAHNENGYGYGDEINFLTKPAAPTDVAATENQTDKVVITWTKSTGATDYHVWRDAVDLGASGDVDTEDDAGATAGTITNAGTATATDGTIVAHVELSLEGEATGTTSHTYKVVASNATGNSDDSDTDTGHRTVDAITYAWQVSDADSDDSFNPIGGGTTDPYNYAGAPANGDGRWYYCIVSAVGASNTPQDSTHDRGYRGVLPTVTVQAVGDISYHTATGNGNITSIGTDNCDKRGFVWDLGTQGDPGDVAPGASGYANNGASTGDFGIGAYTYGLTGLLDDITYYVRAYVHSPAGYDYSDTEVNFKTLEAVVATVVTYNADVSGIDATLNGNITATGEGSCDYRGFVWGYSSFGDPGNTAPGDTAYDYNWTETGSFGIGIFDHEITLETALSVYFVRACVHNVEGWVYGEELDFFTGEADKVYLEFRPDLDETRIRGNAGIPTNVRIGEDIGPGDGIFVGYSLPIWNENDEELYYMICVPDRWDGESHVLIHIVTAIDTAGQADKSYRLEVGYEWETPNEDDVPFTNFEANATRTVNSNVQYESYMDWFIVLRDADVDDELKVDDQLALRLRRLDVEGQLLELGEGVEVIILRIDILFARGDFLADPEGAVIGIIDDLIADETLIGGEQMLLLGLIFLPLGLTIAMFATKKMMLGFPCGIFWAILGAYCYGQSEATWDIYYALFFASMFGMLIFTILAAYALRTKKEEEAEGDEFIDEGKEDLHYIDEGKGEEGEGSGMSERTKGVRGRAKKRREKASRRMG